MIQIAILVLVVVAIIARRPIIGHLRHESLSTPYHPSRFVELGLLIVALGIFAPIGLAEGGFVTYDVAFIITAGAVALGLATALAGFAVEFRRNFFQ